MNDRLGLLVAAVLACLLVGWLAYISGHQTGDHQNRRNEYEQTAKRNAALECSGNEPAAVAECVYDEINSAAVQAQSEQDLEAQQWMALWAGVLTFITLGTTLISWVALGYLRESWRLSKLALEIETRPFVFLDSVDWTETTYDDGALHFRFTFNIKNLGKLPATNVRLWTSVMLIPEGDSYNHHFEGDPVVVSAAPQGVTRRTFQALYLDYEEASYFEGWSAGIALGLKIIFDTRFTKDKCIEEFRWVTAYGLRELKTVFLDRPEARSRRQPDLFDEQREEMEAEWTEAGGSIHEPPLER